MSSSNWKVIGALADPSRSERRSLQISYWDVVEASLDIEAVIDQTFCFSKTIVMNIDTELRTKIAFSAAGTSLLPWIQSDRINCKVWRTMSVTAKFHSTHHKTWDATTARFNLDQGSSQLQCISSETELKKSKVWPWSDFSVCTQPNRRSLDLLVTLAYINYELRTRYLPAAYTKWPINMEYCQKSTSWTWRNCQIHVTYNVYCALFCCSRSSCRSLVESLLLLRWYHLSHSSTSETFHL